MTTENKYDVRLHTLKAVDAVLAALQTTFAHPRLLGDNNPFRYVQNDPANSAVWVCDPEGREGYDRNGGRRIIMVSRGEFQPLDMHLYNRADGAWDGQKNFSDLTRTPVFIRCESGNRTETEVLASIVYQVLTYFRQDMMKEFDIHTFAIVGISSPVKISGAVGEPWQSTVSMRVEVQEQYQITELTNRLNMVEIVQRFEDNRRVKITSFDTVADA